MQKKSSVLVIGRGLIGNRIYEMLIEKGYNNVTITNHKDLELLNQSEVNEYFKKNKPEFVFFCAVKAITDFESGEVGDGEEAYDNIMMQCNVINSAKIHNVKKMIMLGSAMLYPWNINNDEPLKEEQLSLFNLPGYRPNMHASVIGKFVGLKLCEYYNKQYRTNFIYCLPTHIYGGFKNRKNLYLLEKLVISICDAKNEGKESLYLDIFGKGISKKQFLHVDDCSDAIIYVMEKLEENSCVINIGSDEVSSWKEIVDYICKEIDYRGKIFFNNERKENMANRICNIEKLKNIGWRQNISMKSGIKILCNEYNEKGM